MAELTPTKKLTELHELISKMKHVFLYKTVNLTSIDAPDYELPVLENGANVDTGGTDLTVIKLTTGEIWAERASKGDADISFRVASVAGEINDLLMKKQDTAQTITATIGGKSLSGTGYSTETKKVTGGILLTGEDGDGALFFPNVALYASFVGAGGDDETCYYNCVVVPYEDTTGATFYPLLPVADGEGD